MRRGTARNAGQVDVAGREPEPRQEPHTAGRHPRNSDGAIRRDGYARLRHDTGFRLPAPDDVGPIRL